MKCKRQCWSHVQCLCSGIGVPPFWPSFRTTILTTSFRFLEKEWTVAARWTYAQCGPRFQGHTAVTGTFRFPLRASWRAAPRSSPSHASWRGQCRFSLSLSIRTPTETERQSLCTWPGEFPSYGWRSAHHHCATLEFRTMVSNVLSTRFT